MLCAIEGIFAGIQCYHKGVHTTAQNGEFHRSLVHIVAYTFHLHLIVACFHTTFVGYGIVRVLNHVLASVLHTYGRLLYATIIVEVVWRQRYHS